ncbi:serine hydroxymethyltransferase, putative [Babesia bigemina]|uniref:Serine hydroxymethyltransferase n=1 Tax=Babesia bigemina TaxID=5866 RepID=A0A061D6V8_BABBI|nr:serine hydroxymethyltransferase, putative [Babesia bigemina]CDR95737.1 serine hydroxymethyltransferase, putative [Babesia bigemina]|eukprot:XP_012767923.1 serine hydroxymethyltransferase, putative [Babesia bigemina]
MPAERQIALPSDHLSLKDADPEIYELLQEERQRQRDSINLIASENFASIACMEATGSAFTNKYAEGYPGRRYYGGCEVIDKMETLCIQRALKAFHLDEEEWGVNVQPLSGSPANMEVYVALLEPHDKIMGLRLASGGHLTHGFHVGKRKISASSIMFTPLLYDIDQKTGLLDYDQLEALAKAYSPRLIIAGASCYSRYWDYKRCREIADSVGAYLMADIAHIAGLIAAEEHPSPFEYCHVVTSTTHKTLKGPRSGLIFYNKKLDPTIGDKINAAVFPAMQGGPHNNTIAGLAVQLKTVMSPEWKVYVKKVIENARALASECQKRGFEIVTGGTDNHTVIVNVKPFGVNGNKVEHICNASGITLNTATVPGDTTMLNPSGVRLGSPAMTSRGATPQDMAVIAEFILEATRIAQSLQEAHGAKMDAFKAGAAGDERVAELRRKVTEWVREFPIIG